MGSTQKSARRGGFLLFPDSIFQFLSSILNGSILSIYMREYEPKDIEPKWQKIWADDPTYARAEDDSSKKNSYILVEFPFPSGAGLHTGHVRSYTALDSLARKRRAQGENVLYPMGWDAFGLPTENYAIKTGRNPKDVTAENVATYKKQMQDLGVSFDWSREINTTDPNYYKWTQWIFLQLFKNGLAYKSKAAINWCPKDKIGLANEEVVDGCCERCGTAVEKREREQWMLAITKYAERLYDDLDTVDYIEAAKAGQRNWIGPSKGAEINFEVKAPRSSTKLNEARTPKISVQRYKGLGEMNAEELWETTMDPARRILKQVAIEDAQEADKIFDILMGTDVPSRKSFIQSNARMANLDI